MNAIHLSAYVTLALSVCVATSSSLAQPEFPREIQAGIAAGTVTMPVLIESGRDFKAYTYFDNSIPKYLLEYQMIYPSSEMTHNSSTRIEGAAWFGFSGVIHPSEPRHDVWMYLDLVQPRPTNMWVGDSDGLDVRLSLTTADLLAGSAYMEIRDSIVGDLQTIGDLMQPLPGQSFVPCLAGTCAVGAEVNLLHVKYQMVGPNAVLTIKPVEPRQVLYHQWRDYLYDPSWYRSQTLINVPEPTALILAALGIVAIVAANPLARRAV